MSETPELSERQIEFLTLVARGKTQDEIANITSFSPHTVKDYLTRAREALGARNLPQAVARAVYFGFIKNSLSDSPS